MRNASRSRSASKAQLRQAVSFERLSASFGFDDSANQQAR
jgi:hypothetical protein